MNNAIKNSLLAVGVFLGLYIAKLYSYVLFHSIVELFSIVVACAIFIIAWNSRKFIDNNYLIFLGIACLFVATIDTAHTLAYKGMGVFPGYTANLPTQLWIAARYMGSISLFIAPFYINRKKSPLAIFVAYSLATSLLFLSIFYLQRFPDCFIEGTGLTNFKIISEYIICLMLVVSIMLLIKNRRFFDGSVLRLLISSIIVSILTELAFTLYVDVYGFLITIGHFLKAVSFYLIYLALVETGLKNPHKLLFKRLKESEEEARRLSREISIIAEIGRIISSTVDIDEVYQKFANAVSKLISFDGISIPLINDEKASVVVAYVSGISTPGRLKGTMFPLSGSSFVDVIKTRSGMIIHMDSREEVQARFPALLKVFDNGARTVMLAPLISQDKVIGALHIRSFTSHAYSDRDLKLAESISSQIAGAIANVQMFNEVRQAENTLKSSLKEKEVLLREIHHRVKNNFNVISSILNLQSSSMKDKKVQEALEDCRNRIRVMSLIHTRLYQSSDLSRIDIREYVTSLVSDLFHSYAFISDNINLKLDIQNVALDLDTSIPLGLIINELVSNALKYAFPEGRQGEIAITLKEHPAPQPVSAGTPPPVIASEARQPQPLNRIAPSSGQKEEAGLIALTENSDDSALNAQRPALLTLTVSDNGIGLPEHIDFRNTDTLGMLLVTELTEQLEGTIELIRDKGTAFVVSFAKPDKTM